ncbi:MAG: peptidoglycan-binding protein [Methylobacterium sp.]|uniref:peptidoglycan-binding protein n=1 Tax=Methylobacterium sp. TaxID=409 RepID=UPI0025F17372|nr:peptidoglycan-binding protein [Methylobacterium sp.]MBX9932288.1 peptidoglycan-binding protein [Methylobacterium sp.]
MARRDRFGWSATAAAILMATGTQAQAPVPQRPLAPPKPATAPDTVFDAAKAAYESLPEPDRKALQDALVWTGDYNSVITGTYGRRTHDALMAYAARAGAKETGFPAPATRAALLTAGEAARKAAKFTVQRDPASGVTLGVPERMLPKRSSIPGGTRWQSADGGITLDAKSFSQGETDLDATFARLTAPSPDRKVTYKIKRPDFLVVTAETAQGKSYIRYASGADGIRGFTIGYGKQGAADIDRFVIAIANSFAPFETAAPGPAPSATPPAVASPKVPLPKVALPKVAPSRPAPAATGLSVGPGRVLTSAAALAGCATPTIAGKPSRVIASDPARGLALLEGSGLPAKGSDIRGVPLAREAVDGSAAVILGAEAAGSVVVAPGEMAGEGVFAPLQPGSGGAPVFDRSGRLAGLVSTFPTAPRLIAGVMPPTRYVLVSSQRVAAFLAENGVAPSPAPADAGPGSVGSVTARLGGLVVGITCGG